MKPRDVAQLSETIKSAMVPFELIGCGTKRKLGRPMKATPLDLSAFNKIISYEPEELILECGAATKLDDIKNLLQKNPKYKICTDSICKSRLQKKRLFYY